MHSNDIIILDNEIPQNTPRLNAHEDDEAVRDVYEDDDDDEDENDEDVEMEGNLVKNRRKRMNTNKDGNTSEKAAGSTYKWIEMGPKTLGTLKQKILNYLHQCDDALNKIEVEVCFFLHVMSCFDFLTYHFLCSSYFLNAFCMYWISLFLLLFDAISFILSIYSCLNSSCYILLTLLFINTSS